MKKFTLFSIIALTSICMATAQQYKVEPSISVKGEGIVNVVPDKAIIKVRVEEEGKSAQEVKSKTDTAVDNVIKFLRKMNIKDKNVQTDFVRLDKTYDYNGKTYNYTSNQAISIKLEDLDRYESLMNGLIESGINRIEGIQFGSSKTNSLEIEARKKAVKDAKTKAEQLASALGQSVGKAITISEVNTSNYPQPRALMMKEASSSGSSQETLAKGEMQIKIEVNVTFNLN